MGSKSLTQASTTLLCIVLLRAWKNQTCQMHFHLICDTAHSHCLLHRPPWQGLCTSCSLCPRLCEAGSHGHSSISASSNPPVLPDTHSKACCQSCPWYHPAALLARHTVTDMSVHCLGFWWLIYCLCFPIWMDIPIRGFLSWPLLYAWSLEQSIAPSKHLYVWHILMEWDE